MVNRDLLKEAIADAKAVKETAIVNAKAALEEAFTPYLKERLAAKLAEMDNMDEDETMEEGKMKEKDMKEGYDMDESYEMEEADDRKGYEGQMGKKKLGTKEMSEADEMEEGKDLDEMDLDELLRELESMDEDDMMEGDSMDEGKAAYEYEKGKKAGEKEAMNEEEEGMLNDPKGPTAHGNVAEEEEVETSEEEEIDIENMDESDLKKFIESVISDMVEAGELEAGDNMEGEEEESEEEVEINERKKYGGNKGDVPASKRGDKKDTAEEEGVEDYKKKVKEMKHELEEAYNALSIIKTELQEVNLFNAKLLYTNKIFKAKNLTESQKVKVLAAFDKAASVKEAKLVFETLSEGMKETKKTVNESMLRGSASKAAGVAARKPILEVNDQFARWQTLAGIKK
jgi:hypothetical protein